MPDTHAGKGCVIGFTADLGDKVVPNLVGVDVCNCIIWRQQDAKRNSIQSLAQSVFSHKESHGLSCDKL